MVGLIGIVYSVLCIVPTEQRVGLVLYVCARMISIIVKQRLSTGVVGWFGILIEI